MVIKRFVVLAVTLAVLGTFFVTQPASAAIPRCGFILFAHRLEASRTLMAAQQDGTHDIFDFVHAMFSATAKSQIDGAFTKDLGSLNKHFGDALIALRRIDKEALAEFTSGACTGASSSTQNVESLFYGRMELQLEGFDAQALATLTKLYGIALRTCC